MIHECMKDGAVGGAACLDWTDLGYSDLDPAATACQTGGSKALQVGRGPSEVQIKGTPSYTYQSHPCTIRHPPHHDLLDRSEFLAYFNLRLFVTLLLGL